MKILPSCSARSSNWGWGRQLSQLLRNCLVFVLQHFCQLTWCLCHTNINIFRPLKCQIIQWNLYGFDKYQVHRHSLICHPLSNPYNFTTFHLETPFILHNLQKSDHFISVIPRLYIIYLLLSNLSKTGYVVRLHSISLYSFLERIFILRCSENVTPLY